MISSTALRAYTSLISDHSPTPTNVARPETMPAARVLLRRAHTHGPLPLQGPWRLHPETAQQLTRDARGHTPAGGWHGLASVLSGTSLLKTTHTGFCALQRPDALELWTEAELQQRLLEAMSMHLIPPTTAAGLFMMLGLHPAWGLRVANETHKILAHREDDPSAITRLNTLDDEGLFPHPSHAIISHAIFASVSIILEALRTLDPDHLYSMQRLADLVLAATRHARHLIRTHSPRAGRRALAPFIDDVTGHLSDTTSRVLDFTMLDLVDHYLVPAGVVHRFNTQTFCVWPDAIPDRTHVFGHGALEDQHVLADMIARDGSQLAS